MVSEDLVDLGFVFLFFQYLFLDRLLVGLHFDFVLILLLQTFHLFLIDFTLQNKAMSNLPRSALTVVSEFGSFPPYWQ